MDNIYYIMFNIIQKIEIDKRNLLKEQKEINIPEKSCG